MQDVCLLFYTIATVFHFYHGSNMMYEMRRRKHKPTPLLTQRIFKLLHHVCMVWEELTFNNTVSYTQRGNGAQLNVIAATGIRTLIPQVTYPAL